MAATQIRVLLGAEFPPAGDLRKLMAENPLPELPVATVSAATAAMKAGKSGPVSLAEEVVQQLNNALAGGNSTALAAVFFAEQAFFRDQLVLTYDTRTFSSAALVAATLLETTRLRQVSPTGFIVQGPAVYIAALPTLVFIDASFVFHTETPAATGTGRLLLVPVLADPHGAVTWKIWIFSTQLDGFDAFQEDEGLLTAPVKCPASGDSQIETDVFILGGGNAGVALGARLKALGVSYLIVEKNARPGDNWAKRYDNLHFHTPSTFSDLPYMSYDKALQRPHLLTRNELAGQVQRFVQAFPLNALYGTTVRSTQLDTHTGVWNLALSTPGGNLRTVVARHLVQATGIGSQVPNKPKLAVEAPYAGLDMHSSTFKNASGLQAHGAHSVAIIGSANTAFDVLQDCVEAGMAATMVVRSPTYVVPAEHVCDTRSLGLYDVIGVAAGDRMFLTLPAFVDGQLSRGLFAALASAEPDRYAKLAAVGFPVIDSRDPDMSLMHNLLERAGGHYIDVGATELLVDGRAAVRGNVEPVAYTASGLRLSDGSTLDVDAIVWCTGFADRDIRRVAASILGGDGSVDGDDCNDAGGTPTTAEADTQHILSPSAIAERIDATWGLDSGGEIRGLWKRHSRLPTYWVMGGYTQQHRAFSRTLALQLKAALEGILPLVYQDTPLVS